MGFLFFFLSILVIPGLPSGALVPRWGLLAIASAILLFRCELSWLAWALVAYLALMTWYAPSGFDALYLLFHACFFVVLFAYAKRLDDLRSIAIGLGLGIALNSIVVLTQQFWDAHYIPQLTPDAGLFFNRNVATEAAAMALMLVIGYRLWWLVPPMLPSLIWGSRSPTVALGCGLLLLIWARSKILAVLALLLCVALAAFWLQDHGLSRLAELTVSQDPKNLAGPFTTLQQRFFVWYDGLQGFRWFGQGLGSWIVNFPLYQRHSNALELRWENAHNDAVQLVFEFGVVGIAIVAVFVARLFTALRTPEFYTLVVFAVESLFEFPLYDPVTGALAAVCAGYLFSRSPSIYRSFSNIGLRIRDWHSQPRRYRLLSIR